MTVSQESLVSSSQDVFGFSEESKPMSDVSELVKLLMTNASALKTNASAQNKIKMEMPKSSNALEEEYMSDNKQSFPWLSRFSQLCWKAVGSQSIKLLEHLLCVYLRNVSVDVQQCYKKPKRAGKLKTKIIDALKLFFMLYSDIKKPLECTFYWDKMSDLMAMYMDMEIKASRRSKERPKKISERLSASVLIFLDKSPDHVLDAVLNAKFFTKRFRDICIPIIIRVLRENPGRIMNEMTFIRYLLTFKLWKKLVDKKETRIEIVKLAVAKLIPPKDFLEKLRSGQFSGILPYVAKSEKDRLTYFLMQAPFNVKEKAEAFLKICRGPKEGMSVVHPVEDVEKPFFVSEDTKFSSEPEPQVDDGTSTTLMNNIWSSMGNTDDSEPGDCSRLCNELSFEPKTSKKVCKKIKEKPVKTKNMIKNPSDKIKKKNKSKDQSFEFVHEAKPKTNEGEIEKKMKELSNLQRKQDNGHKIKEEKLFDEIDSLTALQSKIQGGSMLGSTNSKEEVQISVKKDFEAAGISKTVKNSCNRLKELVQLPEVDSVNDMIKTIKLDEKKDCLVSKQANVNNQRDVDLPVATRSVQEKHTDVSFLNSSKPIEEILRTNYNNSKVNLDNFIDKDEPVNEPSSSTETSSFKTIDLCSNDEPTVIKTENVDENEPCCVIIDDDDDDDVNEVVKNKVLKTTLDDFDVSKISHEIVIGVDIANDRLDSLSESDITNYPTIPGSESFGPSKDIQSDMQTSFPRDICIGDQYLQLPSFFEGNEDVVSRVLCDWPTHQENFGLYKEHDNSYLPTVLLRNDINFGVLFPEVAIDNEEEEEEINYQGQGQYARGAKVAFGDMATVEDNETEWDTRDQDYEESSPVSRDDSNRVISEVSPVTNNSPLMSVESDPQRFVIDKPAVELELQKSKKNILEKQTTYEINGGYDLSKFQQVSVNLHPVDYDKAEKPSSKGTCKSKPINIHKGTLDQDYRYFSLLKKYSDLIDSNISKKKSFLLPPRPIEIIVLDHTPLLRCRCSLCNSNWVLSFTNYKKLLGYTYNCRDCFLSEEAELKKSEHDELSRNIKKSIDAENIISEEIYTRIEEKDTSTEGRDIGIKEKDSGTKERDTVIVRKSTIIEEKNTRIDEKDPRTKENYTSIEKESTRMEVEEKNTRIDEKDPRTKENYTSIEKEGTRMEVEEKNTRIDEKDPRTKENYTSIEKEGTRMEDKDVEMEARDVHLEERDKTPELKINQASLPLKKRKSVVHTALKQDEVNNSAVTKDYISPKKRKKMESPVSSENKCTNANRDTKSNRSEHVKRKGKGKGKVPIMKVIYTSPEGNKLTVKKLTENETTQDDLDSGNVSHRHRVKPKRSKEEKRERKEQKRLKKQSKSN